MSDEKFQNKYRIKSARATWHDYGDGAYFITVCTKNHEHFFGEITAVPNVETRHATSLPRTPRVLQTPTMQLSPIGQFLTEKIQNVPNHCPYAEIPLFVIMPNHWHAIVFIDSNKIPYIRRNATSLQQPTHHQHQPTVPPVETWHAASLPQQPQINKQMQIIANMQPWLSVTTGGIKSAVTKFANENNIIDFAWQTRFHDHIIRDQKEMNRIANYIENNPATWNSDCFNSNM